MLLVKSNESKSSGKQTSYKTWVWLLLSPFSLSPFKAFAEPASLSNPTSIVSIFLSLLLVIGIVFALAYVMRQFNVTQSGSSQLKIVASMMAGSKERVIVIDVGGEQHLLGITAHNINHLAKLDTPIAATAGSSGDNFKHKLAQFMAGKTNTSAQTDKDDHNA
jgi:flagellar protein FliO/FliZ